MKRIYRVLIIVLTTFIFSCNPNNVSMSTPEIFQPNWEGITLSDFKFKFGDKVQFEVEKQKRIGLIVDFTEEEGGKWVGICFMNNENQLFGRQIPSGFSNNCIDLLDISYLNENGFDELEIIGNYEIDKKKIGIGSKSPAANIHELERDFMHGIDQRKMRPTNCKTSKSMLNPVNECYFELQKIMN
ncbi:MAG TPA: hypothetical protein PLY70_15085 [Saprospiraceae bacterium]|nr:hypothetical protein [Saprospiraceae bacterium]